MAAGLRSATPLERIEVELAALPGWLVGLPSCELSAVLPRVRGVIDRTEAAFARGVASLEKSGEFRADGALSMTAWLRSTCKLSGSAAAERVDVARALDQLPKTQAAFAQGAVGYQHVAVLAHAADNVGVDQVRKAETNLLQAAQTLDPGQFTGVTKQWEHRVDAEAALSEANRARERRYLHISEPVNGQVLVDGRLDTEGGAIVRTALNALMRPAKDDTRSHGQRQADALVELCRRGGTASGKSSSRPYLIVRATIDTLAGTPGAPAGELDWGGPVPAETVRRVACDTALTRMVGRGELDAEITHAVRTCPPSTRRALEERDRRCRAQTCDRPADWCDAHHLQHWIDGGPTTLSNLTLLCRRHHIMVHEEGWQLRHLKDGRWGLTPPTRLVPAHARSA